LPDGIFWSRTQELQRQKECQDRRPAPEGPEACSA
jgi:hypothetical protein